MHENGQLQSELFEEIDRLLSDNTLISSIMKSPILTLNSSSFFQGQQSAQRKMVINESEDQTESLIIRRNSNDDDIPLSLIQSTKRFNKPSSDSLKPFTKQLRTVSSVPDLLNRTQFQKDCNETECLKAPYLMRRRFPDSDPESASSSSPSLIASPPFLYSTSTPKTPLTQTYPLFLSSPSPIASSTWSPKNSNVSNIKMDENLTSGMISNGQISNQMKSKHLKDLKQIHQEIDQKNLKTQSNQFIKSKDLMINDLFKLDQELWFKIKNEFGSELKSNQSNQLYDYYLSLYQQIRLSVIRRAKEMVKQNQNQILQNNQIINTKR